MARKPPPRHVKPTARQLRRAVPRHAIEPEIPFGAVSTLAVTVAGAVVVASSAYGYVPTAAGGANLGSRSGKRSLSVEQSGDQAAANAKRWNDLTGTSRANSRPGPASSESPADAALIARLAAQHQSEPAFVKIPSIHTTSSLINLGLTGEGVLEVPQDYLQAGWYQKGPRPGDPGPAVIAGHLDSKIGPGIFSRLAEVKPGDLIEVTRVDGQVVSFIVTRVDQYPKRAFPTRQVYGKTDRAELRVITCGGSFDRGKGSYNDNIVVFARLQSDEPRPNVAGPSLPGLSLPGPSLPGPTTSSPLPSV
jgi:sortase (surface protein transpeptidase)